MKTISEQLQAMRDAGLRKVSITIQDGFQWEEIEADFISILLEANLGGKRITIDRHVSRREAMQARICPVSFQLEVMTQEAVNLANKRKAGQ